MLLQVLIFTKSANDLKLVKRKAGEGEGGQHGFTRVVTTGNVVSALHDACPNSDGRSLRYRGSVITVSGRASLP
jgi:hypothetical protein